MLPLRWIDSARRLLPTVSILLVAFGLSACRDGGVDDDQVCAFQCDYQFDGGGDPEAAARLTQRDVVQVIANAVQEAQANGIDDITVAVLDHLSNVLAVYDSNAATTNFSRIASRGAVNRTETTPFIVENCPNSDFASCFAPNDPILADFQALDTALDGLFIPAGYAAISKAGTSNYFSTQGNAFTTRTANTLIQQNFVPGETDRPGGPLFAVQIAQLACSDVNTRQTADPNDLVGPRRLPVGFAADPGAVPLYKDDIPELDAGGLGVPTGRAGRVVVGAVGVEFNGVYALDKDATDTDRNLEERIAVAASRGFEADTERRATRITVAGRALRFVDDGKVRAGAPVAVVPGDAVNGATAIANVLAPVNGGVAGQFVFDEFFFPFVDPRQGVFFTTPESGVIPAVIEAPAGARFASAQGEVLVDGVAANPRFMQASGPNFIGLDSVNPPPGVGPTDGLTSDDVSELLVESLRLAERTRAQTRRPLGGQARVDVAVVDLDGNVIGFARSRDALLDGVDVTIAKTRTAAFWSKALAQQQLRDAVDPLGNAGLLNTRPFGDYVDDTAAFLGLPAPAVNTDPPFNGDIAWSSIALGGISNPDFPPGVADADEGPLSRATGEWSIFSTGIQTEVVLPGIALAICDEVPDLAAVLESLLATGLDPYNDAQRQLICNSARVGLLGVNDPDAQTNCLVGTQNDLAAPDEITGLQNGFHIFQGAVPIYRGNELIGAIGVSGDGAEQDDFVPFVALSETGKAQRQPARAIANPINNAPENIRADNVEVQNIFLRYVVCPTAPYLTSNEQTACEGR